VDQALKEQALAAGVNLRFQTPVEHLSDGGVVSRGPLSADVIAVGYRFETDLADGVFSVVDERLAPKGYSYLLINRGRATLASCMFRDFHNEKVYLERSLQFFRDKVGFEMKNPRSFGGFGNFMLPATATQGQLLFAGEAAGFQDRLWGFGMRYALLSGHLAARAIISQNVGSYEHLWRERLGGYLQTSMVNRYLYEKLGNSGYRWLLRSMGRAKDPRDWLRKYYAPAPWKAALLPLARHSARSTRRATEFVHEDCDCTWCRCQHSLVKQ
jgi:flavin-dependent dehydrogenase